jgi:hypothetical protein
VTAMKRWCVWCVFSGPLFALGGCPEENPPPEVCPSYCSRQVECIPETENAQMERLVCERECADVLGQEEENCADARVAVRSCLSAVPCEDFIEGVGCESEFELEAGQCRE